MKKLVVAAVLATTLISFEAQAQDRGGSAVLGGVSGLVVFGPVGAVAGAVVGYTAGPAIAHSWGIRQPARGSKARRTARSGAATKQPTAAAVTQQPAARTPPPPVAQAPAAVASTKAVPPIQTFE
jgi:hypothetical protein